MMKKVTAFRMLSLVAAMCLQTACGLLHESEPTPAQVTQDSGSPDCEFPTIQQVFPGGGTRHVRTDAAQSAITCLRKNIDTAFSKVHGQSSDTLSAKELYRLSQRGIIHLKLKTEAEFDGLGGVLSLFNPRGEPAIAKSQAILLADVLQETLDLYAASPDRVVQWNWDRLLGIARHLQTLFPGKGVLTEIQFREMLTLVDESKRDQARAAFPGLRLVLRHGAGQAGDSQILGASVRELVDFAVDSFDILHRVSRENQEFAVFVLQHEEAIERLVDRVKSYFQRDGFDYLPASDFRRLLLSGAKASPTLTEDVLLLARRFINEPDSDRVISTRLLDPFLNDSEALLQDLKSLAHVFGQDHPMALSRRQLLARGDPLFTSVALKARSWRGTGNRQDSLIDLDSATESANQRFLFRKLFVAFGSSKSMDPIRGIYLPKKSFSTAEEQDARNLARLFIKFASALSSVGSRDDHAASTEINIETDLNVKAESVYRIMGLIGDQWYNDGNGDDYLNSEEFFSVISLFMESTGQNGPYPEYFRDRTANYWRRPVYPRVEFIRKFLSFGPGTGGPLQQTPYSALARSIEKMKAPDSLLHALMSRSSESVIAYHEPYRYNWDTDRGVYDVPETRLRDWLSPSDIVPAHAILDLLDRTFLKCDLNQDDVLDWKELDCAASLLSGALYYVTESGIVSLDPGVHDAVLLFAKAVYSPDDLPFEKKDDFQSRLKELPRVLFKLYLARGNPHVGLSAETLRSLKLTPRDLIPWVVLSPKAALQGASLAEVERVFGACDANHDSTYQGEELECIFKTAAQKWLDSLKTPELRDPLQKLLPFLTPEQLAQALSSEDFKAWFVYLAKGDLPFSFEATATTILDAFEQAIRRSCPLGNVEEEGRCSVP